MREAYAGVRDFESRVQEAASKQGQLQDLPILLGTLLEVCKATKKSLRAISVDSPIRQFEISAAIRPVGSTAVLSSQVCLQVKLLPDPNKSGWTVQNLADLPELNQQYLQIRGLMTILL